jgi:hypothetical protein
MRLPHPNRVGAQPACECDAGLVVVLELALEWVSLAL